MRKQQRFVPSGGGNLPDLPGSLRHRRRLNLRRLAVLAITWLLFIVAASRIPAAAADLAKATTSRAARQAAIQSMPLDKLDAAGRDKVAAVLDNVSIYRRLPVQIIGADPQLYLFLVNNPDAVVNLWEVLGISQITLRRNADGTFAANDGQGMQGQVEFLHRSANTHVIYTEGEYRGPLSSKPVRGSCVMLLKSGYIRQSDGKAYVTSQLDIFIRLEHVGMELIARTFQPVIGKVADYNFLESTGFVSSISQTAEVNPAAAVELASRMEYVPEEERQQMVVLLDRIGHEAMTRSEQVASLAPPERRVAEPKSEPPRQRTTPAFRR